MKQLVLSFAFITVSLACIAGGEPYSIANINPLLLKGANVIKRTENIRFEMESTSNATLTYKYAFTILNENGNKHAGFAEWYDKLRQITSIEGTLYDAEGKVLKRLKPKDVQDLSAVSDISLIDDGRQKVHSFYHRVYPYTVEYEVRIKYNNTFHFPGWITQEDEHIAVENSEYHFVCPQDYTPRYRAVNYIGDPVQTIEKGKKTLSWKVSNLPAITREPFAPRWKEIITYLSIAPTQFEIQGYKGDMSTWKDFGKFLYELKKNRDALPNEVAQKVHQLTDGLTDKKEKVKVLYNFLQQNTRYISIQLGLGGWQPFEASYVAKKGYGDCKALSNYMHSLLKEITIPSYYAVIKAGPDDHYMMEDFPSNQFNHAVLCVPLGKDTMWLECTSQTDPAGYMGNFTGNRKALLIDESGGTLVNTPRYALNENVQMRNIKAKVDDEGGLDIVSQTAYHSIQQDRLHQLVNGLTKDKLKEFLQEELDFPTYNINDFQYTEKKEEQPQIKEALRIYVAGHATLTGKRLFVAPNLMNRTSSKLSPDPDRKYDICFYTEYKDVDSVQIELPVGYEAEAMPPGVSLKTKFGAYSNSTKLVGNTLHYVRVREYYSGRFPAKEYNDLVKFYDEVYKADRAKVVLVKKQ